MSPAPSADRPGNMFVAWKDIRSALMGTVVTAADGRLSAAVAPR